MLLTLLGTGTSFGVPQIGCSCGVCRSEDPRDRRTRCAALLETGDGTTLLIDTPPELRLQLVAAGTSRVDAVLYTHAHADHIAGIDDLRMFSLQRGSPLPLHGPVETLDQIRATYRYIFDESITVVKGTSKPSLSLHPVEGGSRVRVAGVEVLPLEVNHGNLRVFGYRIGPVGYLTDAKAVPEPVRAALRGVEVLVLNALWWRTHPTHLSIPEAIETAQAIGARRTLLTHLTHETGHAELAVRLPAGIEPGYDGQVVEV